MNVICAASMMGYRVYRLRLTSNFRWLSVIDFLVCILGTGACDVGPAIPSRSSRPTGVELTVGHSGARRENQATPAWEVSSK
jgi:hypothetical protein